MKKAFIYLTLTLYLVGCGREQKQAAISENRVVKEDTAFIKTVDEQAEKIKEEAELSLKIKQRDTIRHKLDLIIQELKDLTEKGTTSPEDMVYFYETLEKTCNANADSIEDISFEALQNCENSIDYIGSQVSSRQRH
jgi:prophage DNA circulation protein